MIKKLLHIVLLLSLMATMACNRTASDPNTKPEDKLVDELTAADIFSIAIAGDSSGGEVYQGESYGREATGELSIYADGNCCEKEFIKMLIIENKSSEQSIITVIKAKFKLPDNDVHEITRMYTLQPHESEQIGCSHICHQGNSYMIQREIMAAGYIVTDSIDVVSTIQ